MKPYLVLAAALALGASSLAACSTTTKSNTPATEPGPGEEEIPGEEEVPDGEAPASTCPGFAKPTTGAKVAAEAVEETSGIVASTVNPDVFWLHNDSGDIARTFAVNKSGELLATVQFDEKKPDDIEDIAIEDVGAGKSNLYFADIGDNAEERKTLTIHRFAEPKVASERDAALTVTSEKMTVVYSDGPHNAETLLFDPIRKELLIATKKEGGPSYIHRVGAFDAGSKATTEKIATVDIDFATGGDISRDGKYIAIRNPGKTAYLWIRESEDEDLAEVFKRKPCTAPIASEKQGEALGWLPDASGFMTISEGTSPAFHETLFK